jgi:tetratricopeptide (TPR) repeat protein
LAQAADALLDEAHASTHAAPESPPARPTADDAPLARGATVGRYRIVDIVGVGGMGVVYAAFDPELDRKVALKLLRTDVAGAVDEPRRRDLRARLLREAQAMARLSHPDVIAVHDVGTFGDQVFIAMELVDGGTLAGWLRERPRGWREVLRKFVRAGRGLAAAHAAGLVHRDFKPDNVLVGVDGRVRVTDFGLARPALDSDGAAPAPASPSTPLDVTLTRTGALVGTPAYMAPEQMDAALTDARSDLFSFSVALWEALYCARPFDGDTLEALRSAILDGRLREPPRGSPVPAWIRRELARGLRARPEERPPSLAALLDALDRDRRRRSTIAIAAAAGAVALSLGAVLVYRFAVERPGACVGVARPINAVWGADRRAAVERAFTATRLSYASGALHGVMQIIDEYAVSWAMQRTQSCEATRKREQSAELGDLRAACLDERLRELDDLARALSVPDEELVRRAPAVAAGLLPLDNCSDVQGLTARTPPPRDARARAALARAADQLLDGRVALLAGRLRDAEPPLRAALATAREHHYRPQEAIALYLLSGVADESGDPKTAASELQEAVWAAEAGHDDIAATEAAVQLLFVAGGRLGQLAEVPRLARQAQTELERVGHSDHLSAALENTLGALALAQHHDDEARRHLTRALELFERLGGPTHLHVGEVASNLSGVASAEGKLDEAEQLARRALAIFELRFGPDHPDVAVALEHLVEVLAKRGGAAEALPLAERALSIRERALGRDHPDVSYALSNLGGTLHRLGRDREALAAHRRELGLVEKSAGREGADTAAVLEEVGVDQRALGDLDGAAATFARALAIEEKSGGGAAVVETLGELELDRRAPARAVPWLERALAAQLKDPGAAPDLATTRFALARALDAAQRDRAHAVALARAARDAWAAAGATRERDEADAWLRAHGGAAK